MCSLLNNLFSTDLSVTIDVAYRPPVDFDRRSVNEFRAGSGPVALTCQVEGATGTVSYQWTSTCTGDCFVLRSPQTNPSVTQLFLRAGVDDGTHTCTATDSDGGETGSASFLMRIIGMFVSSPLCTSIPYELDTALTFSPAGIGVFVFEYPESSSVPTGALQTMALLSHYLVTHLMRLSHLRSSVVLVQSQIAQSIVSSSSDSYSLS